ncbi:MAG: hypothetical protein ACLPGW_11470 [Roseiarcus sp.]
MAEFFQAFRVPGDLGSNLLGRLAVLKGDLDWHLHVMAPSFWNGFDALLIGSRWRVEFEC